MKNIKLLIAVIALTISLNSISQPFTALNSGTTESLGTIHFTDDNTGYILGLNGTIKKTTDGGTTWKSLISGTTKDISDILFRNKDTGYCSARGGVILKTTNGGKTWSKLNSGVYTDLSRIAFTSKAVFITGYSGVLLRSLDEGATWTKLNSTASTYLYGAKFLNDSVGFISGLGVLLKTVDGGNTWNGLSCPTTTHLFSIHIMDKLNILIVGGSIPNNEGHIVTTADGGKNWKLTKFKNTFFGTIQFIDKTTGYISVGDTKANTGTIYKTLDGGKTWKLQKSSSKRLFGAAFPSKNVGYFSGLNGALLKTTINSTDINEVKSKKSIALEIYPNPTSDILNLEIKNGNTDDATITILDINGRKVKTQKFENIIDISNLAKGTYLINVTSGTDSVTKRIIKK